MDAGVPRGPELQTVASGGDAGGHPWRIQVGGTPDDLITVLEVRLPDGRLEGGGLAGPALPPDRPGTSARPVSAAGNTPIVGPTTPSVAQVNLHLLGRAAPVEVPTVAGPQGSPVRFFAAVMPGEAALESVVAVDTAGHAVPQRRDPWLGSGPHRPGRRPPGDHAGGWSPA
jgi:hypothetical protein